MLALYSADVAGTEPEPSDTKTLPPSQPDTATGENPPSIHDDNRHSHLPRTDSGNKQSSGWSKIVTSYFCLEEHLDHIPLSFVYVQFSHCYFCSFAWALDQPLQLIHPDPNHHRNLEIISSNVKHLHHIHTAVAVVAVVGKFHSGKSFLLNQLMGKQEGFGVGPSVRPHTMGIWMWGKV